MSPLRAGAALTLGLLAASPAAAEDYFPPVSDPVAKEECSACHMAFPPDMLTEESWRRIMGGLDDHFGENASLPPETVDRITRYLVENAGSDRWGWLSSRDEAAPLRITDTDWWRDEHEHELSPAVFERPDIRSKANCAACHRGAEQGVFEDD